MGDDEFSSKSEDEEFKVKETDNESEDELFINRKAKQHIPKTTGYIITFIMCTVGFIVGATLVASLVVGTLCAFDVIGSIFGSGIRGLASSGGSSGIVSQIKQQFIICSKTSLTAPSGILSILLGGLLGALPGWKAAKAIAGGKYLRSML